MAPPDPQKLSALQNALTQAGEAILTRWPARSGAAPLELRYKPDGSMVTAADFESNGIITCAIRTLFPDDRIVSEEGPIDADILQQQSVWILDPLDGTQSFVEANEDFSILLAQACQGILQYCTVLLPARNQRASACIGHGATHDGKSLHVSSNKEIRPHALYLRHFEPFDDVRRFAPWLDSAEACLRLCRGELDAIVVRIKKHKQWDVAPFALLAQESGGTVTDEHGKELFFGGADLSCRYFVATNGLVHAEVLALVRDYDQGLLS